MFLAWTAIDAWSGSRDGYIQASPKSPFGAVVAGSILGLVFDGDSRTQSDRRHHLRSRRLVGGLAAQRSGRPGGSPRRPCVRSDPIGTSIGGICCSASRTHSPIRLPVAFRGGLACYRSCSGAGRFFVERRRPALPDRAAVPRTVRAATACRRHARRRSHRGSRAGRAAGRAPADVELHVRAGGRRGGACRCPGSA